MVRSALLGTMLTAMPAKAAEAAAPAATGGNGNPAGSEIVVTAQRRSEKLVDVPSSVAVVSQSALDASAVQSLHQLGELVPGLFVSAPVGLTAAVYIRGVGADSRNIGFDSRVGVFVDGIYAGQSPALDQELVDVERIEILRGPQGTFFGKNTVAGAVNIITRAPSDEPEGRLQLRGGNRNQFQATGAITLPIATGIAARFASSYDRRDGRVTNLFDGTRLGNIDADAHRAQIRFEPADALSVSLTAEASRYASNALVADNLTDTFGFALDAAAPGPARIALNDTPHEKRNLLGLSALVRYRLPDGQELIATTSYRRTKFRTQIDEDWSTASLFKLDYRDRYRNLAEELQLVSPADQPIRYLLGAYHEHQDNFTDRHVPAGTDIVFLPLGVAPGAAVYNRGTVRTEGFAAYLNLTADVTDRLEANVGARYSVDRKRVNWTIDGSGIPAFNLATGTLIDRTTDHDLSPSVALSYRLDDSARIYARYAEGYKSGGFNLDFVSADIFPHKLRFAKETVRSYEIGLKAKLPQMAASLNIAGFVDRYANYQVNQFQDLGGGRTAIVIANAASVQTRGLEVEAAARPARGLSVSAAVAILDARFRHFPGGGIGGADVSGRRLPYASKLQASAVVNYDGASASARAVYALAHLDIAYRSGFFTSVDNVRSQPLLGGGTVRYGYAKEYVVANARAGLGFAKPHLELSLWARNLFDRRYTTWMYRDFLGTILELTGEPRSCGLELGLRF